METLPVTLIVKAPNQQIEDQTVKCELSWTINKLKQHLSEVYPSKPPKHEQKLIYSGQLLTDSLILKDILRQYEGQETHTLHLVCSPRHTKTYQQHTQSELRHRTSAATTRTTDGVQQNAQTAANSTPQVGTTESFPNVPFVQGVAFDPAQYTTQVAMMQQAYIQYMSQYMQLAAHSYANGFQIPAQTINFPQHQQQQQIPQLNPNLQQQNPQQNAQINNNQQANNNNQQQQNNRDPDNPERDWLDGVYMLIRALVLFSFVYFYSSPTRFIFVLLLGFGIYLYQIGFFRTMHLNNNNNNNNNTVQNDPRPEDEAPSRLMLVWTFVATFFASLIPEIPNPV